MSLKSPLLTQIKSLRHGFGVYSEQNVSDLAPAWSKLAHWHQNHGNEMAHIKTPNQECGNVDAFFSTAVDIPIAVRTADCVPILLAQKKGLAIAAIHAGWRGTYNGIVTEVWKAIHAQGHDPKDWVGVVGPAIGPCCYEVSEELASDFENRFSRFGVKTVVPSFRHLDLPGLHLEVLKELGIGQAEVLRHCTYCSISPKLHSARRSKGQPDHLDRQFSGLMIAKGPV